VVERRRSPPGSLIVPASALVTRADGTVEVTVVSGTARHTVAVQVVMSHEGQVAVTGTLAAGDQVMVGG
jgi:multidrug efflux pump subunit AcrA (membrane-fusion protein)